MSIGSQIIEGTIIRRDAGKRTTSRNFATTAITIAMETMTRDMKLTNRDIDEDSQRYSGRTHFSKDKYHYDARNKNRFATLRHQPEPESPSFHGNRFSSPRANFHSTPTQHPRKSQEQKLEKIRKDMREWEESGQWPLSCYSPLGNEPCLNGLNDISAEEMRVEAYEANHNKSGFRYAQEVQTILQNYSQRKHELANMSSFSLEEELSNSSKPAVTLPPGGLFGNQDSLHQSASENTLGGSMDVSSSSLFSSNPSSSGKTSTFLPVTTNSTSTLFQSNQVDVPFARSLSPIAEDVSNDHQTFPTPKCSVSSLRCSEDDLKAFRADRFKMGAVPECPPPLELC
ncbi:nucleoporin NUP42-like isoform X2 [Xenia sp. Carnegie-2017]|uniref:nucleoporin NUP42-like isoform X2 n=1 Tax=Xenia sp. Carnegie-2017 TaxID=2897299 RepID=UPI001F04E2CC|nr:nucleoporin NUP42-like isoform X2 [Xenia sp. Carnegie-2017]